MGMKKRERQEAKNDTKKSARNDGKKFEEEFAKSCPEWILVKKLADNASGWNGGTGTRFSSSNECDFICHDDRTGTFYGLELKSTRHTSFTFWREDLERDGKKHTFAIKKCQILGLKKWSENHSGVFGFLFNFRSKENATYFVSIDEFLQYTEKIKKISINREDVEAMHPIFIPSRRIRTLYRYDLEDFFRTGA